VHDDANKPISVEELALRLPKSNWRRMTWRKGASERLSVRFGRVRVHPAHDRDAATDTIAEQWLLIEWSDDEKAPTNFGYSTRDKSVTLVHLVRTTKQRWCIERDYLELKQEIGPGHFEGRSWRGFHHHATLVITAHGFLICERAAFFPQLRAKLASSKRPPFPTITDRAVLPIRTERHVPDSLAALRREFAAGLAASREADQPPGSMNPGRHST